MEEIISEIDWEFYNKYPRIYAVAEMYGFTKEDIEQMIENEIMLDEYCQRDFKDSKTCELYLRMLMCRLDVHKDEFIKTIKEIANTKTEDEIRELVGKSQVNIVYALAGLS